MKRRVYKGELLN